MGADADNPEYSNRGARYAAWTHASAADDWLCSVSQSRELGMAASTLAGGRSLRWYADTFMAKNGTAC